MHELITTIACPVLFAWGLCLLSIYGRFTGLLLIILALMI